MALTPVTRAIEAINELTVATRILLPSHVSYRVISSLENDFEVCTTDTDFGRAQKTLNKSDADRIRSDCCTTWNGPC